MIPRIKQIAPLEGFKLLVDFDEGRRCVYDVNEDIEQIPEFAALRTMPGLFESVTLDSSRTCVVWNDRIDLPSDTIYEYANFIGWDCAPPEMPQETRQFGRRRGKVQ